MIIVLLSNRSIICIPWQISIVYKVDSHVSTKLPTAIVRYVFCIHGCYT